MKIILWHTSVFGSNDGVYRWYREILHGLTELGHEVEDGRWTNCKIPLARTSKHDGADVLIITDAAWYSNPDFIPTVRRYAKRIPTFMFLHCPIDRLKPENQKLVKWLPNLGSTSLERTGGMTGGMTGGKDIFVRGVFPYSSRLSSFRGVFSDGGLLSTSRIDLKTKRQHLPLVVGYDGGYDLWGDTVYTNAWKLADMAGAPHDPKGWGKPWETPDGRVKYHGVYRRGVLPDWAWLKATAHFTGTHPDWAVGGLEYAALEAIDAGRRAVVPMHMLAGSHYETPLGYGGYDVEENPLDLWTVLERAVGGVLPTNEEIERDLAPHDPVSYARDLLDFTLKNGG